MRSIPALKLVCISCAALQIATNFACAAEATAPPVTVTATRNPVDKSYRKMLKGMDLFEKMHGMAPQASLRFKLLPRQRDTRMDGIEVDVAGDSFTDRAPVAADQTFTLDRSQKSYDEDASVRPNRKAGSLTWRAEVRTPDLPPDTRRLGDLRLECHVGMEADLVSNLLPGIGQIANFLLRVTGFCNGREVRYLFFAERPLFGVTLVAGARREVLPVDQLYAGIGQGAISTGDLAHCDCQVLLDRTFYLPLGDASWPDDTLVVFDFMEAGAGNPDDPIVVGKSSKADVTAAFGNAAVVRFDSGFEVWAYRLPGKEKAAAGNTEFVILFDPAGIVTKIRSRTPAPNRS